MQEQKEAKEVTAYRRAKKSLKYTAEDLLKMLSEYLENAKDDLIDKIEVGVKNNRIKIPRPITIKNFCVAQGITEGTFRNYRLGNNEHEDKEMLKDACCFIYEVLLARMTDQGLIGNYNAPILSRLLENKLVEVEENRETDVIKFGISEIVYLKDPTKNDEDV